jgi:hypothetical protein
MACQKCNEKNPPNFQYWSIIVGSYILVSSVYGTIKLFNLIINQFI